MIRTESPDRVTEIRCRIARKVRRVRHFFLTRYHHAYYRARRSGFWCRVCYRALTKLWDAVLGIVDRVGFAVEFSCYFEDPEYVYIWGSEPIH